MSQQHTLAPQYEAVCLFEHSIFLLFDLFNCIIHFTFQWTSALEGKGFLIHVIDFECGRNTLSLVRLQPTEHRRQFNVYSTVVQRNFIEIRWK